MSCSECAMRRILVVDDETHFLTSIRFTLAHRGVERTDICSDARQALEMIRKNGYDAVLLDISMPYITGTALLQMIREQHPDLPIIMVTAVNEIETAVGCIKSGAFDYLVKAY